ncbi:MAG: hypothetical protein WCP35_00385, partial [Verrucomicrobiota bacterium]
NACATSNKCYHARTDPIDACATSNKCYHARTDPIDGKKLGLGVRDLRGDANEGVVTALFQANLEAIEHRRSGVEGNGLIVA